jgi:murein DD-endopeptidase MepM/ murein hydrolase activator NlpD
MLKRIALILLVIFVIAIGYDVVATAAHALGSGSFAELFPSITPPGGDSGDNYTASGLPYINFNFFDPSGTGRNYITQGYGRTAYAYLYINGWHNGIDLAASFGTPVYAPTDGTVLAVVNQDAYCPHIGFGKYVALDDPVHHLVFVLSHFGTFAVSDGQQVSKGTLLGTVGPTGLETGPHLLVSIFEEQGFNTSPAHGCGPYPQGQDVDPLNYLGTMYQG